MTRSKNLSPARMTLIYVLALSVFVIVGTMRTCIEYKVIQHQAKTAEIVNTAGRQRMLSQRLGWLTAIYDRAAPARQPALREEIKETAQAMRDGHRRLVGGELAVSNDAPRATDIKELYFGDATHLNDDMEKFLTAADAFAAAETPAARDAARDEVDGLARKSLLDKLEHAVSLYQDNADEQTRAMTQMSFNGYIFLMIVILLEALLIFRPAVKRIARQQAELMLYAHNDPLTGSFNRHTFFDLAEKAIAKAKERQAPISVIVVGIDHFDTLTERHGQMFGDDLLREFSANIVSQLKGDDLFGRVAGDEFAVFMPGLDELAASAIAEDIRYNISQHVTMHEGKRLPITASIGVASVSGGDTHPRAATQKAEKALFIAQHQGRDRIVRFSAAEKDLA